MDDIAGHATRLGLSISSWGRFRTGWLMWSNGRPGNAIVLLFVTTAGSSAESLLVVSEVIELPSRQAAEMGDVDSHNSTQATGSG